MKIELDLESRKYIYGMLKLFAHTEKDIKAKSFWAELAGRLGPNQTTAHLRRKEVELIIDIVSKAVDTVNETIKGRATDAGQQLRADALEKILAKAKSKLTEKLILNPEEKEDENGI